MQRMFYFLVALFLSANYTIALATNFTIKNGISGVTLIYDKMQDQDASGCKTRVRTASAAPGEKVKFSVNTNWYKNCVWSFIGYKIMKDNRYIGYLSINISHTGDGPFNGFAFGATQKYGKHEFYTPFSTKNACIGAAC